MAKNDSVDVNTVTNATGLASIIGVSARRIQQLVQDGVILPVSRGKYNLAQAVQAYITTKTESNKNLTEEKLQAEVNFKNARAKREELLLKELEGEYHRADDVQKMTEDLIYAIRHALLTLPGRLSVDCANTDNAMECSELIKKEVYSIMKELADYEYDPDKYEERVRERMKWSEKDGESDGDD